MLFSFYFKFFKNVNCLRKTLIIKQEPNLEKPFLTIHSLIRQFGATHNQPTNLCLIIHIVVLTLEKAKTLHGISANVPGICEGRVFIDYPARYKYSLKIYG